MHRASHRFAHVLVAAVVAMFASVPAQAEIIEERAFYEFNGDQYYGWIIEDDTNDGARPGVLLFHEWWGLDEFAVDRARKLAEAGYVVFCADLYGLAPSGENIRAESIEEAAAKSGSLFADRSRLRRLASKAYIELAKHPTVDASRIVALGYGFGGTAAIELMRSGAAIDGCIAFHPGLSGDDGVDDRAIRAETLVMYGAEDPMIAEADIDGFRAEMKRRSGSYEIIEISGAQHAFSNFAANFWRVPGARYNERADSISWAHVLGFLDRVVDGPTSGERLEEAEGGRRPDRGGAS